MEKSTYGKFHLWKIPPMKNPTYRQFHLWTIPPMKIAMEIQWNNYLKYDNGISIPL